MCKRLPGESFFGCTRLYFSTHQGYNPSEAERIFSPFINNATLHNRKRNKDMSLGIFVMGLIIVINLIVIGAVMYYGAQHDTHTNTRSQESSKAVQMLMAQAEKRNKRLEELAVGKSENQVTNGDSGESSSEKAVSSQLGDAETREKRRQEALARKAARRAQQAPSSET